MAMKKGNATQYQETTDAGAVCINNATAKVQKIFDICKLSRQFLEERHILFILQLNQGKGATKTTASLRSFREDISP